MAAAAAVALGTFALIGTHRGSDNVVTVGQPSSLPPGHGAPAAGGRQPSKSPQTVLPLIFPPAGAKIDGLVVNTFGVAQVPVAAAAEVFDPGVPIYAQDYEGPPGPATKRLLISTQLAAPGALLRYQKALAANDTSRAPLFPIDGQPAYKITTSPAHLQILWQEPSGVVVSLEALNIDFATLTDIATMIRPAIDHHQTKTTNSTELPVTLSSPLPDALTAISSGPFHNSDATTINSNLISYTQSGCPAILTVTPGNAATYDAIAISAGTALPTTVRGNPGVLIRWPAGVNQTTIMWTYRPGVIARLQGDCTNIPALAAGLRTVSATTWNSTLASLKTAEIIAPGSTAPSATVAPTTIAGSGRNIRHRSLITRQTTET